MNSITIKGTIISDIAYTTEDFPKAAFTLECSMRKGTIDTFLCKVYGSEATYTYNNLRRGTTCILTGTINIEIGDNPYSYFKIKEIHNQP